MHRKWTAEELGAPIAERQLHRPKTGCDVLVKIWAPRQSEVDVWACPFQIIGYGSKTIQANYGIDAVQAVQLTLEGVGRLLKARTSGMTWLEGDIGDAGFPRSITYSFGADFYYYLCDLMEREVVPDPSDLRRSHRLRRSRTKRWKSRQAREQPT